MIWAIIVGLIVGALAKFLMPGDDPGGIIITMLLGIGGAVVANYVGSAMGFYNYGEGAGILAAVLGAMLLLFLYRVLFVRRRRIT
jgi:uncharacterized membrane protein YeaQ/YmgE (transglycosylase-associated protein family)